MASTRVERMPRKGSRTRSPRLIWRWPRRRGGEHLCELVPEISTSRAAHLALRCRGNFRLGGR